MSYSLLIKLKPSLNKFGTSQINRNITNPLAYSALFFTNVFTFLVFFFFLTFSVYQIFVECQSLSQAIDTHQD